MVELCGWNSETVIVEQWNSDGGTGRWNSATVKVEQCVLKLWNSNGITVLVEQWNSDGETVEQC